MITKPAMSENNKVGDYYSRISRYYHLFYDDWEVARRKEALQAATVLRQLRTAPGDRILDASAGIGTQAIALRSEGFQVFAMDLSFGATLRLRSEMSIDETDDIPTIEGDMKRLPFRENTFRAVIALDNSIPHLESLAEVESAFLEFRRVLLPGSSAIVSVRDYEAMKRSGVMFHPRKVHDRAGVRWIVFDIWDFVSQARYKMTTFILRQEGAAVEIVDHASCFYQCFHIEEICQAAVRAGFSGCDVDGRSFFQPFIIAR